MDNECEILNLFVFPTNFLLVVFVLVIVVVVVLVATNDVALVSS